MQKRAADGIGPQSMFDYVTCLHLERAGPSLSTATIRVYIGTPGSNSRPNKENNMPSLAHTRPRKYGKGSRASRITGRQGGMALIRKYGLNMKRQEFRELARSMGWNKYN